MLPTHAIVIAIAFVTIIIGGTAATAGGIDVTRCAVDRPHR